MKRALIILLLFACAGCSGGVSCAAPPDGALRVVSYNIFKCQRGHEAVVAEIKAKSPDVVFCQEVRAEDAAKLAEDLGMRYAFERHKNYPNEGVAIYSRTALSNVEPVFDPDGRACALFADTVIGGRTITLVSVHLQASQKWTPGALSQTDAMRGKEIELIKAKWKARGSSAVLIGGDFNQIPMGRNYSLMRETFHDALGELGRKDATLGEGVLKARVDYFLHSGGWKISNGGVADQGASDHRMIWVDATMP